MPIEIKELHIRINVEDRTRTSNQDVIRKSDRDALIAECVEQVMDILAKKEER
jgi:hypothetical protein